MKIFKKTSYEYLYRATFIVFFVPDAFAHPGHEGDHGTSIFIGALILCSVIVFVAFNKWKKAKAY